MTEALTRMNRPNHPGSCTSLTLVDTDVVMMMMMMTTTMMMMRMMMRESCAIRNGNALLKDSLDRKKLEAADCNRKILHSCHLSEDS